MAHPVPPPGLPARPARRLPLRRPLQGRIFAGVCAGLAAHLNVPVKTVRWIMALSCMGAGAGLIFYVWLWITVPSGDPALAAAARRPAALSRLAPMLQRPVRELPWREATFGVLLLGVAVLLICWRAKLNPLNGWLLPILILAAGLMLAWSQLDLGGGTGQGLVDTRKPLSVVRLVGGLALVIGGIIVAFVSKGDAPAASVWQSMLAGLILLLGVALALAPWWLRLLRSLGDERAARAREAERADIAAHLHDSVLQTLALIRANAEQSEMVSRLARAQERELRSWLYEDRPEPGTSLAAEVRGVVAEVEDATGAEVGVVIVGDCPPGPREEVLVRAGREALLNAVRHGEPPVSLYLEVTDAAVELFVRDKGNGFDLNAVPADRLGVRESIIGRVARQGGTAHIRCVNGTEIRMTMPRERTES